MFTLVSRLCYQFPDTDNESLAPARIRLNGFKYKKGTEIFGEKEPADYVYQVISGAVRTYKLLSDGRRQIDAFHLAADIFGLEIGTEHRFTAEAIADTTVRLLKRSSLELAAEIDVAVTRKMLSETTKNLQHAEDHILLLGRKTALERVAAFLLEMDKRLTAAGILALPMGRRDIADYLGVTLETVSRALSSLHAQGILGFNGHNQRQIVLLDREKLANLDLCTERCAPSCNRAEIFHFSKSAAPKSRLGPTPNALRKFNIRSEDKLRLPHVSPDSGGIAGDMVLPKPIKPTGYHGSELDVPPCRKAKSAMGQTGK